ncbi:hypothetical protein K469DRAFT_651760 [Zopfia rhizophila CBS 207.26]|uniref:Uncharacterized protein n=1 Tax=Zopfia rhizophila CBS 207.26 TaxID=1314779 RepID=A0A6A6EP83_9PEZI|nr:hypothetical protein K469DRAFT_651760 [Zopfia rhizophila CBS 207.26]
MFEKLCDVRIRVTLFPLEGASPTILEELCQVLWDWKSCSQCQNRGTCSNDDCPWWRSHKLEPFFQFYRRITSWSIPEERGYGPYALRNHSDLFSIIGILNEKPDEARSVLIQQYFSNYEENQRPNIIDQNRAFNLATRVMTMVYCSVEKPHFLAIETLDSFQTILFPLDEESRNLLSSMVLEQNLDPNCLEYVSSDHLRDEEADIVYHYWGPRLMALFKEIENSKPRGIFGKWLERRSRGRHVMIIAIAGAVVAIATLAVAVFQSWISHQQWKHPITHGTSQS